MGTQGDTEDLKYSYLFHTRCYLANTKYDFTNERKRKYLRKKQNLKFSLPTDSLKLGSVAVRIFSFESLDNCSWPYWMIFNNSSYRVTLLRRSSYFPLKFGINRKSEVLFLILKCHTKVNTSLFTIRGISVPENFEHAWQNLFLLSRTGFSNPYDLTKFLTLFRKIEMASRLDLRHDSLHSFNILTQILLNHAIQCTMLRLK